MFSEDCACYRLNSGLYRPHLIVEQQVVIFSLTSLDLVVAITQAEERQMVIDRANILPDSLRQCPKPNQSLTKAGFYCGQDRLSSPGKGMMNSFKQQRRTGPSDEYGRERPLSRDNEDDESTGSTVDAAETGSTVETLELNETGEELVEKLGTAKCAEERPAGRTKEKNSGSRPWKPTRKMGSPTRKKNKEDAASNLRGSQRTQKDHVRDNVHPASDPVSLLAMVANGFANLSVAAHNIIGRLPRNKLETEKSFARLSNTGASTSGPVDSSGGSNPQEKKKNKAATASSAMKNKPAGGAVVAMQSKAKQAGGTHRNEHDVSGEKFRNQGHGGLAPYTDVDALSTYKSTAQPKNLKLKEKNAADAAKKRPASKRGLDKTPSEDEGGHTSTAASSVHTGTRRRLVKGKGSPVDTDVFAPKSRAASNKRKHGHDSQNTMDHHATCTLESLSCQEEESDDDRAGDSDSDTPPPGLSSRARGSNHSGRGHSAAAGYEHTCSNNNSTLGNQSGRGSGRYMTSTSEADLNMKPYDDEKSYLKIMMKLKCLVNKLEHNLPYGVMQVLFL